MWRLIILIGLGCCAAGGFLVYAAKQRPAVQQAEGAGFRRTDSKTDSSSGTGAVHLRSSDTVPVLEGEATPSEQGRLPEVDASSQRHAYMQRLTDSGRTDAEWARTAMRTFDQGVEALAAMSISVHVSQMECYQAGCVASLRFDDLVAQSRGAEFLAMGRMTGAWAGPVTVTGPDVQPDSTVVSDWILYPMSTEQPRSPDDAF
jgi:hypothetical protein